MDTYSDIMHDTRGVLDSFIDESRQRWEQSSEKKIEETINLIKLDMDVLRKNGTDTRMKLIACEEVQKENVGDIVQLKTKLQSATKDLERIDKSQVAHKGLLDTEITQNKEMAQEQKYFRVKFTALEEQNFNIQTTLNQRTAEMQSQLEQTRILWQEFEQARLHTTQ